MLDSTRFDPAKVTVKKDEAVTFRLVNTGQAAHEFTLGAPTPTSCMMPRWT
jgi:uncharacterized cupredoxin-like copper-binding protein